MSTNPFSMSKRIAVIADPAPFRLLLTRLPGSSCSLNLIKAPGVEFVRIVQVHQLRGTAWDYYYEIFDMVDVSDEMLRCVDVLKERGIPLITGNQLSEITKSLQYA